jgi:hypothetical protein
VYTSSKLLSKTKHKMKLIKAVEAAENQQQQQQLAAEQQLAGEGGDEEGEGRKGDKQLKDSVIGSIEEYASLVGKSVHQLADAKYEVPDLSESEGEESAHSGEEGDSLWGAILGGDK